VQSEIFNLTHSTNILYFREILQQQPSTKGNLQTGQVEFYSWRTSTNAHLLHDKIFYPILTLIKYCYDSIILPP